MADEVGNTMRHRIAVALFVILGAIVIGDGLVKSRRAEQNSSTLTSRVAALSPQQLAVSVAECDARQRQGGSGPHDAAFCAEVSRRLDNQPLQIVDTPNRMP
jgi:hypothetical protein